MAEIEWTGEAKSWLQQIYDYIYEKYPDKDIRILLYGHYRIAYLIRDDTTIHILGVLHGALDIDGHLRGSS